MAVMTGLENTVSEPKTLPTVAHVFRECLMAVGDPENEDIHRLLAMTRARYAQAGGDPNDVGNLSQARSKLKARLGSPLTKEKILAFHQENRLRASVPMPSAARNTARPDAVAKVEHLKAAGAFVALCGGVDAARNLLAIVEEVRQ